MDDQLARSSRFVDMMNEMIRNMTPAERDERMQRFIAQSMTLEQRGTLFCGMMEFAIDQLRRQKKETGSEH